MCCLFAFPGRFTRQFFLCVFFFLKESKTVEKRRWEWLPDARLCAESLYMWGRGRGADGQGAEPRPTPPLPPGHQVTFLLLPSPPHPPPPNISTRICGSTSL